MATQEHLKIILRGADAIRAWRAKRTADKPLDLSGANLRRVDLTHADLRGANLTNANLEWADFRWADLMGADLSGSNLRRADFHKADLEAASLRQVDLRHTNLEDANLSYADVARSTFANTRLLNTDLNGIIGLYSSNHVGPCLIDFETFLTHAGQFPPSFLQQGLSFSPEQDFFADRLIYQVGASTKAETAKLDQAQHWIDGIQSELVAYYHNNPEKLHEMPDRLFESLVASIFKNQGFNVVLTPKSRDGGFDVMAVRSSKFTGDETFLIECKRYGQDRSVGVGVVRNLLGVVQMKNASKGIVVTTSYFTKPAEKEAMSAASRLILCDRDLLLDWLAECAKTAQS
jgi:hypothetical protein